MTILVVRRKSCKELDSWSFGGGLFCALFIFYFMFYFKVRKFLLDSLRCLRMAEEKPEGILPLKLHRVR